MSVATVSPPAVVTVTTVEGLYEALEILRQAPMTAWDTESAPVIPSDDPEIRKFRALDPFQNRMVTVQASDGVNTFIFLPSSGFANLKPFLEDPRYLKIGQNLKFDAKQFLHHYGIRLNNIYDTMVAEKVITCGYGLPASLSAISKRRTGKELDKTQQSTFDNDEELTDEQTEYGAQDVTILFPIVESQQEDLYGLERVIEVEMALVMVLAEMELNGFLVDQEKWKALIEEFTVEERASALRFHDSLLPTDMAKAWEGWQDDPRSEFWSIDDIFLGMSPASHLQLKTVLNQRLEQDGYGFVKKYHRIKADPILPSTSTREMAVFRAACREEGKPVPTYMTNLPDYRKWEKLNKAFGPTILQKITLDQRLHPYYNQLVDTGRMSCRNPNLQQMPKRDKNAKKIRGCFRAAPGKLIGKADFSQIELRIIADFSNDRRMIDAFLNGEDLHKRTASLMHKIPLDKVTDSQRTACKNLGFGIIYGMTAQALAYRLDISKKEAEYLLGLYLDVFVDLKKWIEEQKWFGLRDRVARTQLGRIRYLGYTSEEDEDGIEFVQKADLNKYMTGRVERQAVNTPIQGTSADITKIAMVRVDDALRQAKIGRLVLVVHDELVTEYDEDATTECEEIMLREMNAAGNMFLTHVPCAAEFSSGPTWS